MLCCVVFCYVVLCFCFVRHYRWWRFCRPCRCWYSSRSCCRYRCCFCPLLAVIVILIIVVLVVVVVVVVVLIIIVVIVVVLVVVVRVVVIVVVLVVVVVVVVVVIVFVLKGWFCFFSLLLLLLLFPCIFLKLWYFDPGCEMWERIIKSPYRPFLLPLQAILAAIIIANLVGLLKQFSHLKQLWKICKPDSVS